MSFEFEPTRTFLKEAKKLSKKFKSFKSDLYGLKDSLSERPRQGDSLGQNCYKVRMAIASKGKGKRGGARVITLLKIEKDKIHLLTVFDKSDRENITDKELQDLIEQALGEK